MGDYLIVQFDAPLMSFGGATVDHHGVTRAYPSRSMIAGLLGNALGIDRRDGDALNILQRRLQVGARCDRDGGRLVDYQTVDLGQHHLTTTGWTTRGHMAERGKGDANTGTHIRFRHYLVDSVYVVAIGVDRADEAPTLDDLESALRHPERPLFIGRKPCLPSTPLLAGRVTAPSVRQALSAWPRSERAADTSPCPAWWPDDGVASTEHARQLAVTDDRDWVNQVHVGRRFIREGLVNPSVVEANHAD